MDAECSGLRSCSANETHKDCHLKRNSKNGQHEYVCNKGNLGLKNRWEKPQRTGFTVHLKEIISLRDKIV